MKLMKVKQESERAGLKLNIQKTKIMASSPITSWQKMRKQWEKWQTLFFGASKSLQMVIAAMKLKDAPWKKSYDQPSWTRLSDFTFLGSIIIADGDCSHEIKRRSLEEKLWQTWTAY